MARKNNQALIDQLSKGVQFERYGDTEYDIHGANQLMLNAVKEIQRLQNTLDRTTWAHNRLLIQKYRNAPLSAEGLDDLPPQPLGKLEKLPKIG